MNSEGKGKGLPGKRVKGQQGQGITGSGYGIQRVGIRDQVKFGIRGRVRDTGRAGIPGNGLRVRESFGVW